MSQSRRHPPPHPLPPIPVTSPTNTPEAKAPDVDIHIHEKARFLKLSCASCGGNLEVEAGLTNIVCRYCGTPQAVLGHRGLRRLMVLDRRNQTEATSALLEWMKRGIRKNPALKKEAKIEEAFLAFFPFVRSQFDVVGWALGFNEKQKKRGNQQRTVRVPVENRIEKHIDRTLAAAHMSEFGVQRVNLTGDEILPLDEEVLRKRGMIFRPNRAPEESAYELEAKALEETGAAFRPQHTSFSWTAGLRRRRHLIYYPLWVFRYSFRGRTYQSLIDAEDGHLAYGKAPGNDLWRAFALVSSCAGAAFIGTSILQHFNFLFQSKTSLPALIILGLMLLGIIKWGFVQFRKGGVVEEGDGLLPNKETEVFDKNSLLRNLGME